MQPAALAAAVVVEIGSDCARAANQVGQFACLVLAVEIAEGTESMNQTTAVGIVKLARQSALEIAAGVLVGADIAAGCQEPCRSRDSSNRNEDQGKGKGKKEKLPDRDQRMRRES